MITTMFQLRHLRFLAAVTIFSLLASALPTAVFAATGSIETQLAAQATYYVGQEVPMKVLRGDNNLAGGIDVTLISSNGGTFSNANLSQNCTGGFSAPFDVTIASGTVQKAFCYKATAPGTDTITATFVGETVTEEATFEIEIIDLPVLDYNDNGKVIICKYNEGGGGQYEEIVVDIHSTGELQGGHSNDQGTAPQNIIPPYQWLNEDFEVETYPGRNWEDGQELWAAGCEAESVVVEPVETTLTLVKQVEGGGPATADDWELSADGYMGFSGLGGATRTFSDIEFDTATREYELTEEAAAGSEGVTTNYQAGNWECVGNSAPLTNGNFLTLTKGEEVTCTITNEYLLSEEPRFKADITMCKYDDTEEPILGWSMTLTNDDVQHVLLTGEDGCVTKKVDLLKGPWYVLEEDRSGYEQISVNVAGPFGEVVPEPQSVDGRESCRFSVPLVVETDYENTARVAVAIVEPPILRCDFYNEPNDVPPPCVDANTVGAATVVNFSQGDKKVGPITDANRMDPDKALGAPDWVSGGENGFVSLGFAGIITLSFNGYVNEVAGTDLAVYEATNGVYPLEQVTVEVSQNGTTWLVAGVANNLAGDRVTEIDFSGTGLPWIKYVRLTDTTNPGPHNNAADGFDLDAVVATKTTCQPPVIDQCSNIDGIQPVVPEGYTVDDAGACIPPPPTNACLIPNTLGDTEVFVINDSGEKTIGEMFAEHGYGAVDILLDQKNYQVWDVSGNPDTVTFNLKVLGKRAQNTQVFGYYKAGDSFTFTSLLSQAANTDGEPEVPVVIPAAGANSFGFAILSDGKTWYSEKAFNVDGEDHVAVYNPEANTYLLAFEDFDNLGDGDYNDLALKISDVVCVVDDGEGEGDGGSNGTSTEPTPTTSSEDENEGGGGSSATRLAGSRSSVGTPTVAGVSTDAFGQGGPGEVLGDQVSAIPYGAPNTGKGGADSRSLFPLLGVIALAALVFSFRREVAVR